MTVATKYKWERVNKQHPCTVCGRHDYDTYCVELNYACCMRPEAERGAIKRAANGGWLHKLTDAPAKYVVPAKVEKPVSIDAPSIWVDCKMRTGEAHLKRLAERLGVSSESVRSIGAVWIPEKNAYGFPMSDARGTIIGIRIRHLDGDKWSWPGSRAGIFVHEGHYGTTLWIVEGATSLSAMLSLGIPNTIGRASCLGQEDIVNEFIKLNRVREVVIVSDDDPHEAGLRGAEKLQKTLKVRSVIVFCCGWKDPRELLLNKGTKEMLESNVAAMIWRQVK